ncbi:MAG: archease, partial [Planctomycetota bacterium]
GDIGVKVYGPEMKDLFENASQALFEILTDRQSIDPSQKKQVSVESKGWDRLLVGWLSELLYLFEVDQWLFRKCEINALTETRLEATCWGEKYDPQRHEIKTEIKAVTYHRMCVQRVNDVWETSIIFDV